MCTQTKKCIHLCIQNMLVKTVEVNYKVTISRALLIRMMHDGNVTKVRLVCHLCISLYLHCAHIKEMDVHVHLNFA